MHLDQLAVFSITFIKTNIKIYKSSLKYINDKEYDINSKIELIDFLTYSIMIFMESIGNTKNE